MAGDDQQPDDLDDVFVSDDVPIPLGPEQPADHIHVGVAGNVRALAHEAAAVGVELVVATGARRRIVAAPFLGLVELVGDGLQIRPLVVGQPEPLTQHTRGKWIRERPGEIAATGVDERLEHLTGERSHPGLEGGDPLLGEVRLQKAAEHRVHRPVDLERRAGRAELGRTRVDKPLGTTGELDRVRVSAHDPEPALAGAPRDRAALPKLRPRGGRVGHRVRRERIPLGDIVHGTDESIDSSRCESSASTTSGSPRGACFVAAVFLNIIDTTIVNVALPAIGHDLDVPLTSTNAVVVSYLVALAIAIPVGGWLGDRFGPKRVYIASVGLFALASALCGLAQSLDQLVLFRVLQGLGGGIQTPVAMALLYRVYTPSERVRAARVLVLPTSIAPALGPLVGGALVDTLGWRWVFLVNVPIGVATVVFAGAFLASGRGVHPGRFDAVGFVLAGLGLGLVTYGLSGAPAGGWTSVPILASLVAGIVCLAALVVVELRLHEPLLRLRLFEVPHFANANVVVVLTVGTFSGLLFVGPLYLQRSLGLSAFQTGLVMFPEAIGLLIGSQLASRAYPRVGARRMMLAGCVGLTLTSLGFGVAAGAGANLWVFRLLALLTGFSMISTQLPNQAIAFGPVSHADMSHASALYNVTRRVGGAIGVAALAGVLAALAGPAVVPPSAYRAAFVVAGVMSAVAAVWAALGPADAKEHAGAAEAEMAVG